MSHMKKYQQFVACVFIFVCILQVASSAQICEAFAEGTCPDDTCCNPDECRRENSPFKCCNDTTLDDCSNCALCINCEWTEWSACGKLEEQCGDGSNPQRVRGEKTRKYKQQAGPGGIECEAADIDGQKRLTKAPCYKECPDPTPPPQVIVGSRNWVAGMVSGLLILGLVVVVGIVFRKKRIWEKCGSRDGGQTSSSQVETSMDLLKKQTTVNI